MGISEKLLKHMLLKGLNQLQLARLASVSDSSVSRIINGQSGLSLEHAWRLARALGVSLDYLADDTLDADPAASAAETSELEREVLSTAGELGLRPARRLLETALDLGYETAIKRLLGVEIKPLVETAEPNRGTPPNTGRANSA